LMCTFTLSRYLAWLCQLYCVLRANVPKVAALRRSPTASFWISSNSVDARSARYAEGCVAGGVTAAVPCGEADAAPVVSSAPPTRVRIIRAKFSRILDSSILVFPELEAGRHVPRLLTSPMSVFFHLSTVSIEGKQTVGYPNGRVLGATNLAIRTQKRKASFT